SSMPQSSASAACAWIRKRNSTAPTCPSTRSPRPPTATPTGRRQYRRAKAGRSMGRFFGAPSVADELYAQTMLQAFTEPRAEARQQGTQGTWCFMQTGAQLSDHAQHALVIAAAGQRLAAAY